MHVNPMGQAKKSCDQSKIFCFDSQHAELRIKSKGDLDLIISASPSLVILVYVKIICSPTMRKKNSEVLGVFWLLGRPESGVPWTLVEEFTKIEIFDLSHMAPGD